MLFPDYYCGFTFHKKINLTSIFFRISIEQQIELTYIIINIETINVMCAKRYFSRQSLNFEATSIVSLTYIFNHSLCNLVKRAA